MAKAAGRTRGRARRPEGEEALYRALADATRREILRILAAGARPVNLIADEFRVSRPAVSKHLRVLREAGLVTERQDGRERVYSLRYDPLREVAGYVLEIERFWKQRLGALGETLDRLP